jgi:ArsR family transcriptional regulator
MNTGLQQALLFQALGHPERLRILEILAHGSICVCDLVRLTGKRQPYISQHLSVLSAAQLVVSERDGRRIFYRLEPDTLDDVLQALRQLCQSKSSSQKRSNSYV